jgi:D-alanyl-D-alanine dipeptidase
MIGGALVMMSLASCAFAAIDSTKLDPSFKNLDQISNLVVELRYATTNNFMHENLYGGFNKAYLHEVAYLKLVKAAGALQKLKPGYKLLIFDALRPRSVQRKMFQKVRTTAEESYVGNPDIGSVHNFGLAVDLSLQNPAGAEVDMGTPFDTFSDLAQPRYESKFLSEGRLTRAQIDNRSLLKKVMEDAGFKQIPNEWWHFDALPPEEVRAKFQIVE